MTNASWLPAAGATPDPPRNPMVTHSYTRGMVDLHWDDPAQNPTNTSYTVLGCNVYRSYASQRGPYHRVNTYPVGGTFYRDRTDHARVVETVDWASGWYAKGDSANDTRWVIKARHPIVTADGPPGVHANSIVDVTLSIDGVTTPVHQVFGSTGSITLVNWEVYNPATETLVQPLLPTAASNVQITYHYPANVVPQGPDAKVWYRISTVATSTETPSLLTETPLDYCEPRSHMEVENIDYIWREAIRRNNWILEQGGERVKLFIKRLAGQPCGCQLDPQLLEYSGQPSSRCTTCFPPGTLVRTDVGYRSIETVVVGDRVLSSDGSFRKVTKLFTSPYTGDLVQITPTVSARPIWATPEHPFKVLRGKHQHGLQRGCGPKCDSYIQDGDGVGKTGSVRLLPSGKWWARVRSEGERHALGTHATKEAAQDAIQTHLKGVEAGHHLSWDDAGRISKGDWLVAKWPEEIVNISEVHIPAKFRKLTHLGSARLGSPSFKVTDEFLWMLGVYLAEGCKGTRSIHFCLYRHETGIQTRLMHYFEGLGYHPTVRPHPDLGILSAVVNVCSTSLSAWFPTWLGDGCQNKKIPEEIMRLPPQRLMALVQGVYDGDGRKRNNEITQTSEGLALQLSEILHRNGEQPLIRRQRSNFLTPNGNARKLAFCVSWAGSNHHVNRKGRWASQGEALTQVRKVGSKSYSGLVYNLEVEGDHTYVVQGVVVHNCWGTGFVLGYEGPYDIILGPDDGDKRISQTPNGRHMESSYEVWMGPTPATSQRDFVVKQTGERFSIGPVRRPTNRGAFMQQHFTIAYLDANDIRYNVPVAGTDTLAWPETRTTADFGSPYPVGADYKANPQGTEKANIPDEREQRGRTVTYENQNY